MVALGYLGWSEDQALASDVNAILVGYEGKLHMLHYIYGKPKPIAPPKADAPATVGASPPPLTPADFDAAFKPRSTGIG